MPISINMYEGIQVRQQYGVLPERIPEKLNYGGRIVFLNATPDEMTLLFRDMGFGDGLVTKEMAQEFGKGLAQLVRESDGNLKSRLIRLRKPHVI